MNIRYGNRRDITGIMNIMNYYIKNTTAIFDLSPKKYTEMEAWYQQFKQDYPLLVAEKDDKIIGYAYLSSFRPKKAYDKTGELSIYLAKGEQGRGLGYQLMDSILKEAEIRGFHTILSLITDENRGSIAFHEKFNFKEVGCLEKVGFKQNKWLDVFIYQKHLKNLE